MFFVAYFFVLLRNEKATEADAAVAKALGSAPAAEFANVNKWFSEVK